MLSPKHALRQLRAYTTTWTDELKNTQPAGLVGRAGLEHCPAMTSDIIARHSQWPFHLAGDYGTLLFNHRA